MKYYISEFENNLAICEDQNGDVITFPMDKIQMDAAIGDIIYYDGTLDKYVVDKEKTKSREKYIENLMDDLFE